MARTDRAAEPKGTRVRLDKWLWAARFFRTRTLAAEAVDLGQARIDDERVKPSHTVHIGMRISIRRAGLVWEVEVMAVSERRGSATEAQALYRETAQSVAIREEAIAQRRAAATAEPRFPGRPTKRDRRRLQDFLDEP